MLLKGYHNNYVALQVVRNVTLVQVKINGSEYFRKTIAASGQLDVQVLYLGGVPPNARVNFRPGGTPDHSNFKGIIQDVQASKNCYLLFELLHFLFWEIN